MPTRDPEKPGRRQEDMDCLDHDQRLTEIETAHATQAGWIKAAAIIIFILSVVAIPLISWFCTTLIGKLNVIESLLNSSDKTIALHTEQIKNTQVDVKDLQDWRKYIEQNNFANRK